MEYSYLASESRILIYAFRLGLEISLLYDGMRIVRRVWKCPFFLIACMDTAFWIFTTCRSLYFMHTYGNGLLRWYVVLGALATMILYMKCFSGLIVFAGSKLCGVLKISAEKIRSALTRPLKLFIIKLRKWAERRNGKHGKKSGISDEVQ